MTAADRTLLMDQLRNPGRVGGRRRPGINPFDLATSFTPFTPSQQTEDFLEEQIDLVLAQPGGQRIADDVDQYLLGINDQRASVGNTGRPWNRNDVVATAALIGAVFGKGGGDEARRSQLLSALQDRLGDGKGRRVWEDLREQNDAETAVTLDKQFRLTHPRPNGKGNAQIDAASLDTSAAQASAVAQASERSASNAVLVGAERSATGHPFFVAGPQVGYFYPQILFEVDVHGGGIDARGVNFPGSGPYVELGRGQDYSWSATSSGTDIIDFFVEELCGDDTHYRFENKCIAMTEFDAGRVGAGAGTPVVFNETVHGPVIGYATVDGERVAISSARSTRGREVVSAFGFAELNDNTVHDVDSFYDAANKIDFTFNWFYADHEEVAMFSSGLIPRRHPQVDLGQPTKGTGKYEWRGFLRQDQHPHGTAPADGTIVNWNNKPAPRLAGRGRPVELRLGAPQRPAGGGGPQLPAAHAGHDGGRHELRRHAGPAERAFSAWHRRRAADRARAERPRAADVRPAASSGAHRAPAAWTSTSTARSTTPARRSWTRHGRSSRTP